MDIPDTHLIVNAWQAVVVVVVVIGVLWLPQFFSWRRAKEARDEIRHQSKPNSGQSLKDSLNRIEDRQIEQGERIAALEAIVERRGTLEKRG